MRAKRLKWRYDLSSAYPGREAPYASEAPGYPQFDAADCFPQASPVFASSIGKLKTAQKGRSNHLIFLVENGAGEGI
jgi:hypothetical protein